MWPVYFTVLALGVCLNVIPCVGFWDFGAIPYSKTPRDNRQGRVVPESRVQGMVQGHSRPIGPEMRPHTHSSHRPLEQRAPLARDSGTTAEPETEEAVREVRW